MNKKIIFAGLLSFLVILSLSFSSAIVVTSVSSSDFFPGEEKRISITVKNILDDNVEDVSLSLDFGEVPFTPVGSSEDSVDEIRDNRDVDFFFRIRAANDITPGNYEIPYEVAYDSNSERKIRAGTIGLRAVANTDLEFSASSETPVIGREGTLNLKIVNKGFADAKFVSVRIFPEGYTLLSDNDVYIGTVDSDDFETVSFDVAFREKTAKLSAIVEYKDFNNDNVIENVDLPITVYTMEEAINLGIVERNNTLLYIGIIVVLIIIWIVYRRIKKSRRLRKSRRQEG